MPRFLSLWVGYSISLCISFIITIKNIDGIEMMTNDFWLIILLFALVNSIASLLLDLFRFLRKQFVLYILFNLLISTLIFYLAGNIQFWFGESLIISNFQAAFILATIFTAINSVILLVFIGNKDMDPWCDELINDHLIGEYSRCPNDDYAIDSADVVCPKDDALLIVLNRKKRTFLIILLMLFVVSAAYAVGYLNWMWPAYVVSTVLALLFFGLFLRNHSSSLKYFLIIAVLAFAGEFTWREIHSYESNFIEILWLTIFIILGFELVFVINDLSYYKSYYENNFKISIATITIMEATQSAIVIIFLMKISYKYIPSWLTVYVSQTLLSQMMLIIMSLGILTALVSSTIYSFRGEAFEVPDLLKAKKVLERWESVPLKFPDNKPTGWLPGLIYTFDHLRISSYNTMLKGISDGYNFLVVNFINNLVRNIVQVVNSLYRMMIKAVRYIIRTIRRFFDISFDAFLEVLFNALSYIRVFLIPPLLLLISSVLFYGIGDNFYGYVHRGSFFLPLLMGIKLIGIVILFTLTLGLLLKINFFKIFEKFLNAISVIGTGAFLLFLVIAWGLGIIGELTNGPYQIGWVTIFSTSIIIIFFTIYIRKSKKTI